jgi:hypothetical protein
MKNDLTDPMAHEKMTNDQWKIPPPLNAELQRRMRYRKLSLTGEIVDQPAVWCYLPSSIQTGFFKDPAQ